jgi:hypothetical protein
VPASGTRLPILFMHGKNKNYIEKKFQAKRTHITYGTLLTCSIAGNDWASGTANFFRHHLKRFLKNIG